MNSDLFKDEEDVTKMKKATHEQDKVALGNCKLFAWTIERLSCLYILDVPYNCLIESIQSSTMKKPPIFLTINIEPGL